MIEKHIRNIFISNWKFSHEIDCAKSENSPFSIGTFKKLVSTTSKCLDVLRNVINYAPNEFSFDKRPKIHQMAEICILVMNKE